MKKKIKGLAALVLSATMCLPSFAVAPKVAKAEIPRSEWCNYDDYMCYSVYYHNADEVFKVGMELNGTDPNNSYEHSKIMLYPESDNNWDNRCTKISLKDRTYTTFYKGTPKVYFCSTDLSGKIISREEVTVVDDDIVFSKDTYMKYANGSTSSSPYYASDVLLEIVTEPKDVPAKASFYLCDTYEETLEATPYLVLTDNIFGYNKEIGNHECEEGTYYKAVEKMYDGDIEDYYTSWLGYCKLYDADGKYVTNINICNESLEKIYGQTELIDESKNFDFSDLTIIPISGAGIGVIYCKDFDVTQYDYGNDNPEIYMYDSNRYYYLPTTGEKYGDVFPQDNFYNVKSWYKWDQVCGYLYGYGNYYNKTGDWVNKTDRIIYPNDIVPDDFYENGFFEYGYTAFEKEPINYSIKEYKADGTTNVGTFKINIENKDTIKFDTNISNCWKLVYEDNGVKTTYPAKGSYSSPKEMWENAIEVIGNKFDASKAKLIAVNNSFDITLNNNIVNGTASLSKTTTTKGSLVEVICTPEYCFKIEKVTVNGTEIKRNYNGRFEFEANGASNVQVTFSLDETLNPHLVTCENCEINVGNFNYMGNDVPGHYDHEFENQAYVAEGDPVLIVLKEIPEGKVFRNWNANIDLYDSDNQCYKKYGSATSFVMPANDVTFLPVFADKEATIKYCEPGNISEEKYSEKYVKTVTVDLSKKLSENIPYMPFTDNTLWMVGVVSEGKINEIREYYYDGNDLAELYFEYMDKNVDYIVVSPRNINSFNCYIPIYSSEGVNEISYFNSNYGAVHYNFSSDEAKIYDGRQFKLVYTNEDGSETEYKPEKGGFVYSRDLWDNAIEVIGDDFDNNRAKLVEVATMGWYEKDGNKYYFNEDGVMQKKWQKIDNKWYYFGNDGVMQTGWKKIGTTWYYLNEDGVMQTGWVSVSGTWYYLDKKTGAMQTGWINLSGKWYYLNPTSGAMKTGWLKLSNNWFYLDKSGVMVTGWYKVGSDWYYFNNSGVMQKSKWISSVYYVKEDGRMAVSEWVDGGKYYVDENGKWVKNP